MTTPVKNPETQVRRPDESLWKRLICMVSAAACPPQTRRRMTLPAMVMVAPTLMSCPPEEAVTSVMPMASTAGRSIAAWIKNNQLPIINDVAFKYAGTFLPGIPVPRGLSFLITSCKGGHNLGLGQVLPGELAHGLSVPHDDQPGAGAQHFVNLRGDEVDNASELVILAIGMTLVTASSGGQDISVGATMTIALYLGLGVFHGGHHASSPPAIVAMILVWVRS